jgi:hypothetical protein
MLIHSPNIILNASKYNKCNKWFPSLATGSTDSSSWMALQPLWALASFQFPDLFIPIGRVPWTSDQLIARSLPNFGTGNGRLILLRGPLGAWGSLTCSKSTTRVKQLKVPPGGLIPWIFPSVAQITLPIFYSPRANIITQSTMEICAYSAKFEDAMQLHLLIRMIYIYGENKSRVT